MPVAVYQVAKEKEKDPLDTIAKGLSIVSALHGINTDRQKLELQKLANDRAEEAQARQDKRLDQDQAIKSAGMVDKGFVEVTDVDGNKSYEMPRDLKSKSAGAVLNAPVFLDEGSREVGGLSTLPMKKSLDQQKQEAEIAKLQAKDPEMQGLAQLIKQQQAALQGLQIQELIKKAGEIEGPKAEAATYGRRMEQADLIFSDLKNKGYNRAGRLESLGSMLPGSVQSSQAKRQAQAERNFINALLRKESGAAISQSEFQSAEQQYFPRSGDSDDVIAQKEQNRAQAIAGMRAIAGHAWEKMPRIDGQMMNAQTEQNLKRVLTAPSSNANSRAPEKPITKEILVQMSDDEIRSIYNQVKPQKKGKP